MRNMEGKRGILKFFLAIFLIFVLQYKKDKERKRKAGGAYDRR